MPRAAPRAANTAEHQATLARRLTARDRWILHMLAEHRVLTAEQLADCAFPSPHAARCRLRALFRWSVLDRFQPATTHGAAPMHYVLGPAGATVLAATHGLELNALGYRRPRALAIAHSMRLTHTRELNTWCTNLINHAQHTGGQTALRVWWGEERCRRYFGDLVRPDAYALWADQHEGEIEFFLEYDRGTEPGPRLGRKLHDYAALAAATGITTPILLWLPSHAREAHARHDLAATHQALHQPDLVPVATATPEPLPETPAHPAAPRWLPLTVTDNTSTPRYTLTALAQAWPHLPTPTRTSTPAPAAPQNTLPAPHPMPPPAI